MEEIKLSLPDIDAMSFRQLIDILNFVLSRIKDAMEDISTLQNALERHFDRTTKDGIQKKLDYRKENIKEYTAALTQLRKELDKRINLPYDNIF